MQQEESEKWRGTPDFEIVDEEWASNLQQGLEDYMFTLYDAVHNYDDEVDPGSQQGSAEYDAADNTESGIPFCGCNVCEGREILAYVTPRIIEGYLERKVNIFRNRE